MRLTEARYARDMERYRLAVRLLRWNARTRTVERWTGLSMNRVRGLREYVAEGQRGSRSPLRGVTPYQPAVFFEGARIRTEATILAGFLHVWGALPKETVPDPERTLPDIARGARLCEAFGQFWSLLPSTELTIEYSILLLFELARGTELKLARCPQCHTAELIDPLSLSEPLCVVCHVWGRSLSASPPPLVQVSAPETADLDSEGRQGSLF